MGFENRFETNYESSEYNWENKKKEIFEKILYADKNQLSKEKFNDTKEIIKHSVVVDNMTEFRELLIQVTKRYGFGEDFINKTLSHENAHALAAIKLDFRFDGYGLCLVDIGGGGYISAIPFLLYSEEGKSIDERIFVLKAPDLYGDEMSDDDRKKVENLLKLKNQK